MADQIDDTVCAICSESLYEPRQALFTAECGHEFHFRCIEDNSRKGSKNCPVCRLEWQTLPSTNSNSAIQPIDQPIQLLPIPPRPLLEQLSQVFFPAQSRFRDDEAIITPELAFSQSNPNAAPAEMDVSIQQDITTAAAAAASKVTALVTVTAPTAKTGVEKSKSTRPSVDIIAVLDVSGSMSGRNISLLKSTLLAAIGLLGENDRLSIVEFEDRATRLTPLLRMTEAGKSASRTAIASLNAAGGTDISRALRVAAQIVQQRRFKNPVCSVLLLSDGQDSGAYQGYPSIVAEIRNAGASVSTFGYGSNHDAKLLQGIAETGGGDFTYIADVVTVRESFARCMGSLLSVVAQSVQLTVRALNGASIARVIADGQQRPARDGTTVSVGDLFRDETRDVLVEVTLPILSAGVVPLSDQLRYLEASVTWLVPGAAEESRRTSAVRSMVVARPSELSAAEAEALHSEPAAQAGRMAVDRQLNRVRAVEALAGAVAAGDFGRFDEARRNLLEAARSVEASPSGREVFAQRLVEDLKNTASQLSHDQYDSGGSAQLRSIGMEHKRQRSYQVGAMNSYSTPMQELCTAAMDSPELESLAAPGRPRDAYSAPAARSFKSRIQSLVEGHRPLKANLPPVQQELCTETVNSPGFQVQSPLNVDSSAATNVAPASAAASAGRFLQRMFVSPFSSCRPAASTATTAGAGRVP